MLHCNTFQIGDKMPAVQAINHVTFRTYCDLSHIIRNTAGQLNIYGSEEITRISCFCTATLCQKFININMALHNTLMNRNNVLLHLLHVFANTTSEMSQVQ